MNPSSTIWKLYTDGAWRPKLNRGSWGALIVSSNGMTYTTCGRQDNTTSNRMELTGMIEGYRFLKKQHADALHIQIYTDSQYLHLGATQYLPKWMQHNQWRTSGRQPVKNYDLWQEVVCILQGADDISWHWIRRAANYQAHLIAERGLGIS